MKVIFAALLLTVSTTASAVVHEVFPSIAEAVGANLPAADIRQMNKRLAVDVLERFRFDDTWKTIVAGKVRAKMLTLRAAECGSKLGDEQAFIVSAFVNGNYDGEVLKSVESSNAIVRAREYLMYRSPIREEEHVELRDITPGPLARNFVAEWLMAGYDYRAPVEKLARLTLKRLCPQ